ncbi:MAG: adenylate/guanylate cyclase domain-containing protein [Alphaproteobacteria bacterium]|nr:adenylate/guanylate cyclase domain-containing protein [Alphaproteobacteria bacterium]
MADPKADQRLAAILVADVAGYSRLMEADERATVTTLDDYRAVFRERVNQHDGRVVDTAGDSVLAVFPSAIGAVAAAMDIQDDLGSRNDALAERKRMRFRIGVNLGDVIEKADGSVYGSGVNVAARLEALAEPGGVTISEDIFRQVDGKTALGFEDIGEHEVKNIARPVRAYRVSTETTSTETPAGPDKPLPLPDKPSIAVLSFDNLSGEPEQEYFAEGIAEDLITSLSHIRWLFVTARNSTFTYKGKAVDVRQVGKELGVRYVLEGSVRMGANRVRVTAQLIDATTGNHVWAERYDRELTDLFDLQDEITEAIVISIGPELDAMERARARRKPPENLDAWESYQRGLWSLYRLTKDENREARRLFERAITLDPSFAAAHAALAYTHILAVNLGFSKDRTETLNQARHAARRAVAEDEKDVFGHTALGRVYTFAGEDQAAIDEIRTAIDLNPNFALAHHGLALAMISVNKPEEAMREADAAARLSPHDPLHGFYDAIRSVACFLTHDYEQAIEWAQKASRRPTGIGFWPYALLASALAHLGRLEEAERALEEMRRREPDVSLQFVKRAVWWRHDHAENLFEGLGKAGLDIPDEPEGVDLS